MESWFNRAISAYDDTLGKFGYNTVLAIAFLPMAMGGLMVMGGDLASRIWGGFCCLWGVAVIALMLGSEQRIYVQDKEAENKLKTQVQQMEYLERMGASGEEDR